MDDHVASTPQQTRGMEAAEASSISVHHLSANAEPPPPWIERDRTSALRVFFKCTQLYVPLSYMRYYIRLCIIDLFRQVGPT